MTNIKIDRSLRKTHQTKNVGLLWIKQQFDKYIPRASIKSTFKQKLFGISFISLLIAMIFRSLLGGGSIRNFNKKWNNDKNMGRFAGYFKDFSHRLLNRNLNLIDGVIMKGIIHSTVTNIYKTLRIKTKFVAFDSTDITVKGDKFEDSGFVRKKGQIIRGYKLHLAFDIISKLPIAYVITPVNVHDSQIIRILLEQLKKQFNAYPRHITFDRGYYDHGFFKFLDQKEILFYTPAKNLNYFKECISYSYPSQFTYSEKFKLWFKDSLIPISKYGNIRCIILYNKNIEEWMPDEVKNKEFWGILTNDKNSFPQTIVERYRSRWQIEVFFRSCRQQLGLNNLPGRTMNQITTHLSIVLLSYLLIAVSSLEDEDTKSLDTIEIVEWIDKYVTGGATVKGHGKSYTLFFEDKCLLYWKFQDTPIDGGEKM